MGPPPHLRRRHLGSSSSSTSSTSGWSAPTRASTTRSSALYASPIGRVGETLLGAALLYHALNGLRIIVMDFWPATTVWHKQLWYACWVVFFAVGIPGAYIILSPIWTGAH